MTQKSKYILLQGEIEYNMVMAVRKNMSTKNNFNLQIPFDTCI